VPKPLQPHELITAIAALARLNSDEVEQTVPQNRVEGEPGLRQAGLYARGDSPGAQDSPPCKG
jgi:hypothetical protein